jgi:histidinol-phosphate aminotransferase
LLAKYPHLVILRTLSKGFALAGIRCGFVLSSPQIKHVLLKVIAPYPVPDPVAQIATQALSVNGISNMHANVETLTTQLVNLSEQLGQIDDVTLMGNQCGNFVLFKSVYNKVLMQYLVENNVLIRDQSKQVLLDDCLRISIGTAQQNDQLIRLIETFFKQKKGNNTNNQEAVL